MAVVKLTHTDATLLNPIVAIDSPYEVLGSPAITVPIALATTSPISVLFNHGLRIKSSPIILDKH